MDINGLFTSAAINVGVCVVLLSLYSILRNQPSNAVVYFGRRLASINFQTDIERFVPSPRWIVKAWQTNEEEILECGGMDAVVFQRILIFSIRIFSIAAVLCVFLVLPVNYHGTEMVHPSINNESLAVFTIGNVIEGSKWLWVHCVVLYVITFSACGLLYIEFKSITQMRVAHITKNPLNPSHFTILVRSIPSVPGESYSHAVERFFSNYYASSYLSHQMVYHTGIIRKLMDPSTFKSWEFVSHLILAVYMLYIGYEYASFIGDAICGVLFSITLYADAERMCNVFTAVSLDRPTLATCCICRGPTTSSFKILSNESVNEKCVGVNGLDLQAGENECSAAFVFFKTRYAAVVSTQLLQTLNPMLWAIESAPEPLDVLWSNLSIPYRQLWFRQIATLIATIVFMGLFLLPVTFIQGLTQLDTLTRIFPFLRGILKMAVLNHVVTGYLPSVILMLFLYLVPPTMMLFSSMEGPASRSGRKYSACLKILYFTVWNVFFVNVFSGSIISALSAFSSVKDVPVILAKAVPTQVSFFMTYVLTSGWASLACEIMQLFPLLCNLFKRSILRNKKESSDGLLNFPYHTEVPRLLLFGLLGFTCAILSPLILPLLLVYFFLGYLVYRNQIINVYIARYETGGKYWPIAHNTTIFSLVLAQIIALGVFGTKRSSVAAGFTIPLIICTLLFNQYCRQRFLPVFRKKSAQILIEKDREDEHYGRTEEIYQLLRTAYCQMPLTHQFSSEPVSSTQAGTAYCQMPLTHQFSSEPVSSTQEGQRSDQVLEPLSPGLIHRTPVDSDRNELPSK